MSTAAQTVNLSKAASFASVITGKVVKVLAGDASDGPHTNGRQIILGSAMKWETDDRFGVLVHECCHNIFPANYPAGNLRELANLIDDCRIERQFIKSRPHYESVLANLAINVIANHRYDELGNEIPKDEATGKPLTGKDPWAAEHFDPALWALLFFRPHCGDEVRLAAGDAIKGYIEAKGYDKVEGWQEKYATLVEDGQRITRLKTVSKESLETWCTLYFDVFPEAKKSANTALAIKIFNDQPAPKGTPQDAEGEGDGEADAQIRIQSGAGHAGERPKERPEGDGEGEGEEEGQEGAQNDDRAKGGPKEVQQPNEPQKAKGGGSKGNEQEGEAEVPKDLEAKLERAREAVGKVGRTTRAKAQEDAKADSQAAKPNEKGNDDQGIEQDEDIRAGGIGSEKGKVEARTVAGTVDQNFVNRVKMSMRKLKTLVMDRIAGQRKVGRLHLPTVVAAERKGVLARKPFIAQVEDLVERPVACVVATDFSGSTENINGMLNTFCHNALFALQSAGCECAEVVWQMEASITKSVDEMVSAVRANKHNSDGGTSLIACGKGCIESLKRAKATRKVAFVFTDGAVYESEVPMLSEMLKKAGFEACLLVSLGETVKKSGIVDTVVCKNVNDLIKIFDQFVRKQTVRAAQEQYA